ncbi:hypothetical protein JOQ06_006623 [Pogonophryne albipinna]|uniref:Uncharacterized protein n=1 Tax=Pogonophryne albipinna TaxID=1090488 RepID=A0AAD6AZZ9_9TELE|nr:hypothetical protein JOQ06_006623 [Pogonophryne albipinna]
MEKVLEGINTPPVSPDPPVDPQPGTLRQRDLGRRNRKATKAKINREFQELQDKFKKAEQKAEKYKKRLQRRKNDHPSPRSKVNKLIQNISGTSLRRTLLFHTAVAEEDVLTLIPPPENVTSHHMAIAREVWDTLASHEK